MEHNKGWVSACNAEKLDKLRHVAMSRGNEGGTRRVFNMCRNHGSSFSPNSPILSFAKNHTSFQLPVFRSISGSVSGQAVHADDGGLDACARGVRNHRQEAAVLRVVRERVGGTGWAVGRSGRVGLSQNRSISVRMVVREANVGTDGWVSWVGTEGWGWSV